VPAEPVWDVTAVVASALERPKPMYGMRGRALEYGARPMRPCLGVALAARLRAGAGVCEPHSPMPSTQIGAAGEWATADHHRSNPSDFPFARWTFFLRHPVREIEMPGPVFDPFSIRPSRVGNDLPKAPWSGMGLGLSISLLAFVQSFCGGNSRAQILTRGGGPCFL